jgi:ubiquinone/menaquinone biosynthesis C-methylase UbiE
MAFVFHEIEDRLTYLKKIIHYINPKGKLIIFEWEKVEMEMRPPIHDRMSFEEVSSYFSEIKTLNLENKKINGAHYATVINF